MEDKRKFKITKANVFSAILLCITIVILVFEFKHQIERTTPNWPQAVGITGVAFIFLSLSKSPNLIVPAEDGSFNLSTSGYIYSIIAALLIIISIFWTLIAG